MWRLSDWGFQRHRIPCDKYFFFGLATIVPLMDGALQSIHVCSTIDVVNLSLCVRVIDVIGQSMLPPTAVSSFVTFSSIRIGTYEETSGVTSPIIITERTGL